MSGLARTRLEVIAAARQLVRWIERDEVGGPTGEYRCLRSDAPVDALADILAYHDALMETDGEGEAT